MMSAVKDLARLQNQAIGRTVSDLVRRGLQPEAAPVVEIRDGIPVWVHGPGAVTVTSELVRNLAEEYE